MLQIDAYSDKGGREKNEDNMHGWYIGKKKMCFVVADGLGGHGNGDVASKTAVELVKEEWNGEVSPEAWTRLVERAHQKICALQTDRLKMKTTIVGLMLDGNHAVWAHVGDSRLYHFQNRTLVFQTQDHSASQLAVLMGKITPKQIRFHEDRSTILRALGQEGDPPTPQLHEEWLQPGKHAFLLCSDGFWEYVEEAEMEKTLKMSTTAEEWLTQMRKMRQMRAPSDSDNHTAIAVWL